MLRLFESLQFKLRITRMRQRPRSSEHDVSTRLTWSLLVLNTSKFSRNRLWKRRAYHRYVRPVEVRMPTRTRTPRLFQTARNFAVNPTWSNLFDSRQLVLADHRSTCRRTDVRTVVRFDKSRDFTATDRHRPLLCCAWNTPKQGIFDRCDRLVARSQKEAPCVLALLLRQAVFLFFLILNPPIRKQKADNKSRGDQREGDFGGQLPIGRYWRELVTNGA